MTMIKKKLSMSNFISYGTGDMASNLVWQMIAMYLLFFYTDVFGLSPEIVVSIFLVARIWDAFNDPLMGMLVDKTRTKYGKFRPYLIIGSIPLAIMAVLTFSVPDIAYTYKVIYAFVTYILLGMFYTMVNIPYSAMTSSLTQDTVERSKLSSIRMIFAVLGGLIVAGATIPLVGLLGGGNDAKGYQMTMAIYAVISVVLFITCFANTKEVYSMQKVEKHTLKENFKVIFHNKPLILTTITFMLTITASTIRSASVLYYFKYNVGNEGLGTIFLLVTILAMVLGMLFVPSVSKKLGKKNSVRLGLLVAGAGLMGIYFTGSENTTLIFVFAGISGFASSLPTAIAWSMVPDTVEYAQWKTGIRAEGTIYSLYSFGQKLGTAIGGALAAGILSMSGFVADAVQSASATNGISYMLTLIPVSLYLIATVVISFYSLDEEKYNNILEELNAS